MSNIDKQSLTDEAISKAFAGTNFGRDDFKNILAETVIDAAAGWRCGYTATTICTQLGLLTPKGCASALGLRFISEHVQRETKRLKDELEAAEKRIADLEASHGNLREAMAGIHNTITGGGAHTPLAAILNASKRAYEESAAAAGGDG
ncbi:hypothetical protein ABKW03_05230 [Enterobacter hormaechei]